jgi:hypothetical protein
VTTLSRSSSVLACRWSMPRRFCSTPLKNEAADGGLVAHRRSVLLCVPRHRSAECADHLLQR